METGGHPTAIGMKQTRTPKAIIYEKFGSKACYKVEEVQDLTQNGCPGLAVPQKGPCLYRCILELPDLYVVSETFKKKKDAEQSAAEMALLKLGIRLSTNDLTVEEAWSDFIARVTHLFSNEFLSLLHPLSGHFRASLRREGDLYGSIPVSVIAAYDAKLNSLCKMIDAKVESNPFLVMSYVMKAAARLSSSTVAFGIPISIQRQTPYPSEVIEASAAQPSNSPEWIKALYIPFLLEKAVEPVTLNVSSSGYYLDVIAQKIGLTDGNKVLISRPIGKAASEKRLYFAVTKSMSLDLSPELLNAIEAGHADSSLNARASYLYGEDIYGDAILASVGYKWNLQDLFCEDVTLQSYYSILLSKVPSGIYKLSRGAILMAELPLAFTSKTNWRGSFPREILYAFCRQHRLAEPVFSTLSAPLKASSNLLSSDKQEVEYGAESGTASGDHDLAGSGSSFGCEVKIFSKSQEMIIEYLPRNFHKKQNASVQVASLKVLSWINAYLKDCSVPLEKLTYPTNALDIQFYPQNFFKESALCASICKQQTEEQGGKSTESSCMNMPETVEGLCISSLKINGPDSGVYPSNGSLACIIYSVSLVSEDKHTKELLESSEEFQFEIGTGAVIANIEAVVTQMSIGQFVSFNTELLPQELLLAAADDSARVISLLSSERCCLEYSILLLEVSEPPEERMEQALFSPPLSKQRVEYALQHIRESSAATLVDFGCGSGSLLDSLLDFPTSLEVIAGIDISNKSLTRAAKMLHSKLSTKTCAGIKTAVLYDGSITDFDSRIYGFDIGTCLEVIEHMEEDQACLFGDIVLSSFHPKLLIVSTPNYEYNVILQRSSLTSQEDDPDEKTQSQSCKFRNHDHKFEWTRAQFRHWATELAKRHYYDVEFSGVGGSGDVEPGFASQIAVFRRRLLPETDDVRKHEDVVQHYNVIWEWNSSNM